MKPQPIQRLTRYPTIVLFGPSGVGKTKLAASAPQPHFMDSNKGVLTLDGIRQLAHVRGNDVSSMDDLDELLDHFMGKKQPDFRKLFQTSVLDHFDDIQAIVKEMIGLRAAAKDDRLDPDELEGKKWDVLNTKLKRYLRKFKRLKTVKILICGEKEGKDGRMMPALQGALASGLPYFSDHIMYLRLGPKNKRILYLKPTTEVYAKTRSWWLPKELWKQEVRWDDHTFMTRLLETIAAGPAALKTRQTTETE
jgi:hypothetical protein